MTRKATEIAAATSAGGETTRILQGFAFSGKTLRFPEMGIVGGGGIRFDAALPGVGLKLRVREQVSVRYGQWDGESCEGEL
jgi:hypothetical protein